MEPSIYEGGTRNPTPAETTVELLRQGYTPERIIAEAEEAITDAQAGVAWVNAIAAEQSAALDDRVKAQSVAQESITAAIRGGASQDVIEEAQKLLNEAAFTSTIAGMNSGDARAAAKQHASHAGETIANAKARIAAANDPELVKPAVAYYRELKKAEAAALKRG